MNTYLAWLYTNKGARLKEVPVSERSGSRRFERIVFEIITEEPLSSMISHSTPMTSTLRYRSN